MSRRITPAIGPYSRWAMVGMSILEDEIQGAELGEGEFYDRPDLLLSFAETKVGSKSQGADVASYDGLKY